jgi:hypothetical protein
MTEAYIEVILQGAKERRFNPRLPAILQQSGH